MNVIQGLEAVDLPLGQSVLTVGNFDGVHRAHQQLLAQARVLASDTGGQVVVLTFEPHPLTVVAPERAPALLSTPNEKLFHLAEAGVGMTVVARSEPGLLSMEPEAFVRRIVWEKFHPTHIVEGPSFGFGRKRAGTPEMLQRIAAELGCKVHMVEPVRVQTSEGESVLVSSSLIRKLIQEGDLRRAALGLGRPYLLTGKIVRGEGRGRTLGFPTANLHVPDKLIPRDGVYAGRATVGAQSRLCGISIGHTPTFSGSKRQIEAHLLDFDADIYGRSLRIEFDCLIREQRTFDSSNALKKQLCLDMDDIRRRIDQRVCEPDHDQVSAT